MLPCSKIHRRAALFAWEQPHCVVVLSGLACSVVRWLSKMLNAIKQALWRARYRGQRSAWQVGAAPHNPAFRCARLVLQTARYRAQRSACHPTRALAHSPRQSSRVCERIRWQLVLLPLLTDKLAYTASPTTLAYLSRALRRPSPSRSSKTPPLGEPRRGASKARHPQQSDRDVVKTRTRTRGRS